MKFLSNYHYFALSVIIIVCAKVNGQEVEIQTTAVTPLSDSDKKNCTQQLLDWCKNNAYPSGENFVSVMSFSFFDGQTSSRIYCMINSNGTDCFRDRDPWYHCYPNNTFSYKSVVIENSDSPVDDDICETRDTALRYQTSFSNGTMTDTEIQVMQNEMQNFFDEISGLRSMMNDLHRMLHQQFSFGNRDDEPSTSVADPVDNEP